MKKIRFIFIFLLMVFTFVLVSCEAGSSPYAVLSIERIGQNEEGYIYEILFVDNNKYQFVIPFGLDGKDGNNGETPYIGNNNNWWIGNQDLGIKAEGNQGVAGNDGLTPEIGHNGNWWIGNHDTGIKAISNDGKDGIDGENGQDGKDGVDGLTPYIGENGNWWLDGNDLGIRAEGTDGQDGKDGINGENGQDGKDGVDGLTPTIGYNGNWWIGEIDTGVYAGYQQDNIQNTGKMEFAVNSDGVSYFLASYNGKDRVVVIPRMFNGYPVTSIGKYAFDSNDYIEKVIVPNTVEQIEDYAFNENSNLYEVYLEDDTNINYIGDYAFNNTYNLEGFSFQNGLTYIGKYAFNNSKKIENLWIPNTVKNIGKYAFYGHESLVELIFEEGSILEEISPYLLYGAEKLESITIPATVTEIGEYALYNLKLVDEVVIPQGVTKIGEYAFYKLENVNTIVIPSNVTNIGEYAFAYMSNLEFISFEENSVLDRIGSHSFRGATYVKRLEIPDSVTYIGEFSFNGLNMLEYIKLPFTGREKTGSPTTSGDLNYSFFGFIFGGGKKVGSASGLNYISQGQTYALGVGNNIGHIVYYVPSSLKTIVLTNETLLRYRVFYGIKIDIVIEGDFLVEGRPFGEVIGNLYITSDDSLIPLDTQNKTVYTKNQWEYDLEGHPIEK